MFLLECPVDKYIEKSLNRISRNSIKESSNTTTNGIPNVGAINLRTVGKNWYIMSSTSDPIPAFDDDKPGQYSAFTHSLFCGIDEKALDLSNFGKFVNRKFSSTLNSLEGVSIPIVASSLMRDFYFHGNIKTRNKQAEDDQWEIEEEMKREKTARQQRYNGLRVLSMRKRIACRTRQQLEQHPIRRKIENRHHHHLDHQEARNTQPHLGLGCMSWKK